MNSPDKKMRPRWRRYLRGLIIAAVVLSLVAITGEAIFGYVQARRLDGEIARIRAAGEPLTLKDLEANQPTVNESDDAGPCYEAALALIRGKGSSSLLADYGRVLKVSPTSRPDRKVVDDVQRLLADNALALDMLDRGAGCSGCRFDIGIGHGMDCTVNRVSRLREASRLLSLRAIVDASRGEGDKAIDSLIGLLRLRRTLQHQPVMLVYMVDVACLGMASSHVASVLEICGPSDSALGRVLDALLAADDPRSLERMVLAERAYGFQMMRDGTTFGNAPPAPPDAEGAPSDHWSAWGFLTQPVELYWAVGYLRDLRGFLQRARRPLPEALGSPEDRASNWSLFGQIIAPSVDRAFVLSALSTADVRCTAVAIMVEQYRRAHGRLPETLAYLVPEQTRSLPKDPFTGKDLLYRHTSQSFTVYSVGEDGKDNGGDLERAKTDDPPPAPDKGLSIRLRVSE